MKNKALFTFIIIFFIMTALLVFSLIKVNFNAGYGKSYTTTHQGENVIQLSWWGNDARHAYTMEGVDNFQEQEQGVIVSYRYGEWNGYEKRTKVWMESDNEADVMQINYAWLDIYSPDGEGFYDLNELSEYIDLDNFTEEEKAYGTKNGKLNALPIAMNTHVFYYNQDVLDEYGLNLPETWDDLFEMGEALSKDDRYVLGMSKKQMFILLISYYEQSSGKQMFNQDGTLEISKEEMAELIEFYGSLIDGHVLCPVDTFDRNRYMSGEIAGTMCWVSDTKIYCDGLAETGANVSRCMYPTLPNAKRSGWYTKPATMWAISANTEHPEEAAKLLNYLLNDPYMVKLQQTEKGVPVSKKAIEILNEEGLSETNEYKAIEEVNEHQENLQLIIPNIENESIIDAFKQGADEYIFEKATAEECADAICDEINEIIEGTE